MSTGSGKHWLGPTKTEARAPEVICASRLAAGVSKWECGEQRPSRMALKLLAVVNSKDLEVIA